MSGDHKVPTPVSTKEFVIFKYDKTNRKWDISNYSPSQTKDRASVNEIEEFLNEINEPLEAWYRQHGRIVADEGIYHCIGCALLLLLPIFFIYVCWFNAQYNKAKAKLGEVRGQVCAIIRKRDPYFSAKHLVWNVPEHFPQWIELWLGEEDQFLGKEEGSAMVVYEKSGYPKNAQYENKVVPIGGQQQLVYHSNMFEQAHENFSS